MIENNEFKLCILRKLKVFVVPLFFVPLGPYFWQCHFLVFGSHEFKNISFLHDLFQPVKYICSTSCIFASHF